MWLRLWDEHVFHKKIKMDNLSEKDSKFLEIDSKRGLPRFKVYNFFFKFVYKFYLIDYGFARLVGYW